jgi:hypothetical protein
VRCIDIDHHLARRRHRLGHVGDIKDLRRPERSNNDLSHYRTVQVQGKLKSSAGAELIDASFGWQRVRNDDGHDADAPVVRRASFGAARACGTAQ